MSGKGEIHLSTEAMSAYVDGELGTLAHERAAAHIVACFECATAVAIQRQAKTSLMEGAAEYDIPSNLLSRLGSIPFSAEMLNRGDDATTSQPDPRFEFPIAAPVNGVRRRTGTNAFGLLRGRVFKGSAAAVAILSVVVGPTAVQQTATDARGHQMHVHDVVHQHIDQQSADSSR